MQPHVDVYRVRSCECAPDGSLRLPRLLDYLQETAADSLVAKEGQRGRQAVLRAEGSREAALLDHLERIRHVDRLHQRGIGQGLFADPFQILRKRQRSDSLHRGIKEIVRPISDLGDRHSLHLLRDHQRGVGAGVAVRTGVVRIDEEGQRPLFRSSLRLPVPRIHVVVKGDSLALRVFFRRGAGIAVDQVFVNTGILDALREGGDRIRDHQVHPAVSGLVILRKTDVVGIEDAEDLLALANGKGGLICFEGEERFQYVSRLVSHRKWLAGQKK